MAKEILLECSRNKGIKTNLNNEWSNIVSDGLILEENDTFALSACYLNSNGVQEENTIFLSGKEIGTKEYKNKYNEENKLFDKTYSYKQNDNKMTMRNQYFKLEDGNYMLNNPFSWFDGGIYKDSNDIGSQVVDPDADGDSVLTPIQTTSFFEDDPSILKYDDIDKKYLRTYKNRRLTIFVRDESVNTDSNRFQDYVYYPYENEFTFTLPTGYVSKGKISTLMTAQMNNITGTFRSEAKPVSKNIVQNDFNSPALGADFLDLENGFETLNTSLIKTTDFLRSLPCGTEQTMCRQAYGTFKLNTSRVLYQENFKTIGVLYYNTFLAIRQFLYSPKNNLGTWNGRWGQSVDMSGQVFDITLNEDLAVQPAPNQLQEISLIFNEDHALQLYNVFLAQLKDYDVLTDAELNPINERFIHIQATEDLAYTGFGTDLQFNYLCHNIKIHIDPNYWGDATADGLTAPKYGFLWRGSEIAVGSGIYTSKLRMTLPNANTIKYPITSNVRKIGFSRSATSWGNQNCVFYNGINTAVSLAQGVDYSITFGGSTFFTAPCIKSFYIGSQPVFNYNQEVNRFEFKDLHLKKKLGNGLQTGQADFPLNEDAGDPIYKFNQYLTETYNPQIPVATTLKDANFRTYFVLEPWTIFDGYGGTFFDFGLEESYFENSLWFLLGFERELLFPDLTKSKRQIQNNFNNNSYPFTTNANIESLDITQYFNNPDSYPTFTNQQGIIQYAPNSNNNKLTNQKKNLVETIISQVSSTIISKNISINNNQGIFKVKSDVIGNTNFLDGTIKNIFGIIDKSYLINDYIYSRNEDMIFTINKKTIINKINIEIVNADDTPALLDPNSIVIFKVTKN